MTRPKISERLVNIGHLSKPMHTEHGPFDLTKHDNVQVKKFRVEPYNTFDYGCTVH